MDQPILYSVILPVYNQSDQIKIVYEGYKDVLNTLNEPWEILFIVNGSSDDSFSIAKQIEKNDTNVKAFNIKQGGWGRAVKFGLSEAKGEFLCYTNSARTSPEDLLLMLKYAKINENIIVKANRIIRESFLRKLGSTIYNIEFRMLYRTPVWDVNGTPKVLPRRIYDQLTILSDNDLIDAEIIARCYRNNIPFVDVPVISTQRVSGKSTTGIISAIKMYVGLFKMRRRI